MPLKEAGLIEGPRYSLEDLGRLQSLLTPTQQVQFEEITKGRHLTPDQVGEIMEKLVADSTEIARKFEEGFLTQLSPQEQYDIYIQLGEELQELHEQGYQATLEQIDRMIALARGENMSLIEKIIETGALIQEIKKSGK